MSTLRSSVLIISHPNPQLITLGADLVTNIEEAIQLLDQHDYSVLCIPCEAQIQNQVNSLLNKINQREPRPQVILIASKLNSHQLEEITNTGRIFSILDNYLTKELELTIRSALAEFTLLKQNEELITLVSEQNELLKKLSSELEERVDKRQRYLLSETQRLLNTKAKTEALHRSLVAIQKATYLSEMERTLTEALANPIRATWIRIFFKQQYFLQTSLENQKLNFSLLKIPLIHRHEELGTIYFAREKNNPFNRSEIDFINKVCESIPLAIDRLTKIELLETLKQQWETTFDAITKPVCITDSVGKIIRTNKAFAQEAGSSTAQVLGKNCHQVLFHSSHTDIPLRLGEHYQLPLLTTAVGNKTQYSIVSHRITKTNEKLELFVNIYTDYSEHERLERQILQSSKMAELGTIGSSIAHELNNPLGGMLSFLQLIKMDLTPNDPYMNDIQEMESGVLRCRDIIENLLSFSRRQSGERSEQVDLIDVIDKSLKLTELQSRYSGIVLNVDLPDSPIYIEGNSTLLIQVLHNLLQNSSEAITQKQQNEKGFHGNILIKLHQNSSKILLEITDNGPGIPEENINRVLNPLFTTKDPNQHPGLGLTVAYQIIKEHNGELEISSIPNHVTSAKISFSRLVFNH